jgi:hypothetical protein
LLCEAGAAVDPVDGDGQLLEHGPLARQPGPALLRWSASW